LTTKFDPDDYEHFSYEGYSVGNDELRARYTLAGAVTSSRHFIPPRFHGALNALA